MLKKDAIIDYLTKQLFASKNNSLNDKTNLQKDNTNEANENKQPMIKLVPTAMMEIIVNVK